ncbi:hypothetical protein L1987_65919 [Smallanthus sonchifolius]|uniref:Uncharacterized protein n=1 Tax=Smallanthus sonchifolius TaxID=185202 RepID=A0ACB9BVN2_9ASTR|nr:hypothetical protein L1987_65919 [Smallanthus sonchifolius]
MGRRGETKGWGKKPSKRQWGDRRQERWTRVESKKWKKGSYRTGQRVGGEDAPEMGHKGDKKTNGGWPREVGTRNHEDGSKMNGHPSFKEVVLGHKSSHSIKFDKESKLAMGWSHLSLVGEALDMGILCDIKNRLNGLLQSNRAIYHYEIGILVKNPLRISTSINLEWERRTYPVWIQESFRCWAPDFIKEKSGCSLASLSSASSLGGGESFSPAKVNPSPVDPGGEESEPDKEGYSAACMGSSPTVNSKTGTIINCMGMENISDTNINYKGEF